VNKLSDAKKAKLKKQLEKLLAKHGSAYAVAKAIGKSAQTIYERMRRLGIASNGQRGRKPAVAAVVKEKKPGNIQALLKKLGSVKAVAEELGVTVQTIYNRMRSSGIKNDSRKKLRGEPEDAAERRAWFLKKMKGRTIKEAAEALHCSTTTIANRLKKTEIRLRNSKLFPVEVVGAAATDEQKAKYLEGLLKKHKKVKAVAQEVGTTVQTVYEAMRRYKIVL
jgi:DNA invertase Pin-like site-specific DNA recombinase